LTPSSNQVACGGGIFHVQPGKEHYDKHGWQGKCQSTQSGLPHHGKPIWIAISVEFGPGSGSAPSKSRRLHPSAISGAGQLLAEHANVRRPTKQCPGSRMQRMLPRQASFPIITNRYLTYSQNSL
jgi:hypothetical protein